MTPTVITHALTTRTRVALAGATLLALTAAGCSAATPVDPGTADPTASSTSTSEAADDAAFNEADVAFAQMMIIHHRDAVDMARMAPERTTDPDVLALADAIAAAQQPEIDLMSGWLEDWDAEVPPEGSAMAPMEHGETMPGAMSEDQMAQLEGSRDAAFDAAFLTLMIGHHEGAIEMAEDELADGADPAALALAQQIITTQSAEIDAMRELLGS